ncbi:MAG: acyl-CoA dehydrogenase, partial [Rhodospirillaceae bacterium]
DRLMLHAAVAVASDAMGGAESILASTIEYLKLRQQFGKVIGTFQALKHRVADHHVAIIGAEALVENVAEEASRGRPDLAGALECKALATSVYARIAQDCIQLHGGIGFTWEHPAHLFLKRALVDATLFGSVEQTLDRFIARLGV